MRSGGIVLAGGRSERMGTDKASLEWRGEPLLAHVVRALTTALASPGDSLLQGRVVAVVAAGQQLPRLPIDVERIEDTIPGRGPLQGLRDGLAALVGPVDAAFVATADAPLLRPELVRAVLDRLAADVDAVVPSLGGRPQPLTAAYRTTLVEVVDELLEVGERRVHALLGVCQMTTADAESLRVVDPDLDSFVNVNSPADLTALGRRA